jgi:hypothetical protein
MTRLICITLRWIGEPMTEQEGELGLAAPGLATGDLTAKEGLAGQARRLGRQHSSAASAPFGDAEHVYWGEESARLLDALGVTSLTTADNAPGRQRLVDAHCDALEGREPGDDGPGS